MTGQVVEVFPGDGTITLYHDEVPGMMGPMKPPYTMEFILSDKTATARLTPGMKIKATIQRQGRDFVLSGVMPAKP